MQLPPPPLTFTQLEIVYVCRDALTLPRWKGSLLRGGFGRALRQMLCRELCADPDTCTRTPVCTYRELFNPPIRNPHPDLHKIDTAPRPYTIRPPLDDQTHYQPGDRLTFTMTLVGSALDHLLQLVGAWTVLGEMGLGAERGRVSLEQISRVDPRTQQREPLAIVQLAAAPQTVGYSGADLLALQPRFGSSLKLHFMTPLHLMYQRRPARVPEAHMLVRTLSRRISLLSAFYGSDHWSIPFREIIAQAEAVPIRSINTHWVDWGRTSQATGQNMNFDGLVGSVIYEQVPPVVQSLLWLGAHIHVGKWSVFGNGWYRITAA